MALPARNKLLIGAGGFVGLLVAALFALPALLDVNAYKPALIAGVKQATGRDLAIDGAIRLSLLPVPEVTLGGVRFANVAGAKDPDMVTAKAIVVRLSLPALLTGTIAASEATLVAPTFNLEVDAAGQANWVFGPDTGAAGPLPVNNFRVDGGTLSYSDARTGLAVAASRLNVAGSVASVAGPVSLAGSTVVADTPITAHLVLSAKGPAGYTADIAFEAAGGRIAYAGSLSELAPEGRLSGKLSASADNLVGFVEALFKIAGRPRPYVPPLLAGKVSFEGPIEASPTAVAARDFTLGLGGDTVTGSVTATLAPALAVEARFKAARLDLDRWLQTLALPAPVPDEKLQEVAGSGAASSAPASPTNSTAASRGRQVVLLEEQGAARARGGRGGLQPAADPRSRAGYGSPRRSGGRADVQRHPAGRPRGARGIDHLRSGDAALGGGCVQPGRAEAARDAGLAPRRHVEGAGRQARARRPARPDGLPRR